MAVAFGREARMHKRAQRPRSAIDGPQRTRRTALDEQYEYLANQLTKQRMLDREGGSQLDDLAEPGFQSSRAGAVRGSGVDRCTKEARREFMYRRRRRARERALHQSRLLS